MIYKDQSGIYDGKLNNQGYPELYGEKYYHDSSSYSGNWRMGLKEGIGILHTNTYKIKLEYRQGTPYKLLELISPSHISESYKTFIFKIKPILIEDHWEEVPVSAQDLDDYTYTVYFSNEKMRFDGLFFKKSLKNLVEWTNDFITYYGECDEYYNPSGYAEIQYPYFVYIGSNIHFRPHGFGYKKHINGWVEEGNYKQSLISGDCIIEKEGYLLKINCNDGMIKNGTCSHNGKSIKITNGAKGISFHNIEMIENYEHISKAFTQIVNYIDDIKIDENEILLHASVEDFRRCAKAQVDMSGKIFRKHNFKTFWNWREYEKSKKVVSDKIMMEVKIMNNYRFIGEMPKGKGKIKGKNGDYYKGCTIKGNAEGYGEIFYIDGVCYKGEFKNGIRDGIGKIWYKNGDRYKGHWKEDKMHGKGVYFTSTEIVYGIWKENNIDICLNIIKL
ncbi:hypothetical protein SteCoe_10390 [Stentor coeruleus]|uniref:MORN repeat-containing protein 5 n=1 Tax=Stentor coeruleus TaxID=5963 RepID=A0A1R2CFW1_9CILI|nr:hypothetical protein SteCoe_10390 [Stentor coeruleus]